MSTLIVGKGPLPRSRFGKDASLIRETPEWKELAAKLRHGLAPGEWAATSLSKETIAGLPLKNASIAYYIAIKREYSKVFAVESRKQEGRLIVYVQNNSAEHEKYAVAG